MKVIIDRFEEGYAVVEMDNGSFLNMKRELLPNLAEEGDVIVIEIDEDATDLRRKRMVELMSNYFDEV